MFQELGAPRTQPACGPMREIRVNLSFPAIEALHLAFRQSPKGLEVSRPARQRQDCADLNFRLAESVEDSRREAERDPSSCWAA